MGLRYLAPYLVPVSSHWITLVNPSYELWELAARYELHPLEKYCRLAARGKADLILSKGDGLRYFLDRGLNVYMIDMMVRVILAVAGSSQNATVVRSTTTFLPSGWQSDRIPLSILQM